MALNVEAVQSYAAPAAALGRTVPSAWQVVGWDHIEPSRQVAQQTLLFAFSQLCEPVLRGITQKPVCVVGLQVDHVSQVMVLGSTLCARGYHYVQTRIT